MRARYVASTVSQVSHAPGHLVQPSRLLGQLRPRSLGPAVTCPCPRMAPSPSRVSACLATPRLFQERGWFVVGPLRSQPQQGFPKGVDAVWQGKAATTSQQGVSTEMAPSGASSAGTSAGRHLSGTGRRLNGRSPHSTCRRSSSSRRVARRVPGSTAPTTRQRSGRRDWPPGR